MIESSAFCIVALLALATLGVCTARIAHVRPLIYGACGLVCLALLWIGIVSLGAEPAQLKLPLGLPWIGVNLRLDPLAAAFLALIGLGGATGSATDATNKTPNALFPSFPPSSPEWLWSSSQMTPLFSCFPGS
jgi:hypothetical protein